MEENRKIKFFPVLSIDRLDSKPGWPEEFMMMGGKQTARAECFRHRSLNVRETNYLFQRAVRSGPKSRITIFSFSSPPLNNMLAGWLVGEKFVELRGRGLHKDVNTQPIISPASNEYETNHQQPINHTLKLVSHKIVALIVW